MKKILVHITLANIIKSIIIIGLFALGIHWDTMGFLPMCVAGIILVDSKW